MHLHRDILVDGYATTRDAAVFGVACLLILTFSMALAIPSIAGDTDPRSAGSDAATETDALAEEIRRLRERMERLDDQHEAELATLRRRIAALEEELRRARQDRNGDDLDRLRAEAEAEAAQEAADEEAIESQRQVFVGRQRTLQAMNPEISFLGDVSYDWTDHDVRDQFLVRGAEISFQAPLDPFTRFKGFLSAHQHPPELEAPAGEVPVEEGHLHEDEIGVSLEEAYMEWVALPLNTRLRVGKFRQQFGTLNRWHPHALLTADVPFALRNLFGHDGLVGLGVGADWHLPGLWASTNGLTLEIVNADNPTAFAGSRFRDPTVLLRHSGFFDLGPDAYVEIGLSAVRGPNDEEGTFHTRVSSVDFNILWEPVERAKYRGIEVRGEMLHARIGTVDHGSVESTSLYTYVSGKIARRWIVGLRYDDAELPSPRIELLDGQVFREGLRERAWTPFVTFWQSEFVRLRLQYQHTSRDFVSPQGPDHDDRVSLQVTFAAGPHKHESY